jgi:hypothetical protein
VLLLRCAPNFAAGHTQPDPLISGLKDLFSPPGGPLSPAEPEPYEGTAQRGSTYSQFEEMGESEPADGGDNEAVAEDEEGEGGDEDGGGGDMEFRSTRTDSSIGGGKPTEHARLSGLTVEPDGSYVPRELKGKQMGAGGMTATDVAVALGPGAVLPRAVKDKAVVDTAELGLGPDKPYVRLCVRLVVFAFVWY